MQKLISILGSTGSIGCNALEVIALHPQRFQIFALTAQQNQQRLLEQCLRFKPKFAVIGDQQAATQLRSALKDMQCPTEVLSGTTA